VSQYQKLGCRNMSQVPGTVVLTSPVLFFRHKGAAPVPVHIITRLGQVAWRLQDSHDPCKVGNWGPKWCWALPPLVEILPGVPCLGFCSEWGRLIEASTVMIRLDTNLFASSVPLPTLSAPVYVACPFWCNSPSLCCLGTGTHLCQFVGYTLYLDFFCCCEHEGAIVTVISMQIIVHLACCECWWQEEMDIKVLQFQNRKLSERIEQRRRAEEDLRKRIEQLEQRQTTDDDVLCIVNRYWNQVSLGGFWVNLMFIFQCCLKGVIEHVWHKLPCFHCSEKCSCFC